MVYVSVMKTTNNLLSNNNIKYGSIHQKGRLKESSIQQNSEMQNYGPAERESLSGSERLGGDTVHFGGDPKLITNITKEMLQNGNKVNIPKWANKMGGANWFKKLITVADKHETFFEAVTALVVAGIMKPICVLAMPGAEMEDKQMSATKNAVSAFIGFALSNIILNPVSNGVNKVLDSVDSKNPTKYIKDANYVKKLQQEECEILKKGINGKPDKYAKSTLKDSFKTTYKKLPDLGVSPLKAGITIALVPYILKFLFGKDKKKKDTNKQTISLNNMPIMNSIKLQAQNKNQKVSFTGNKTKKDNQPHFTGLGNVKKAYDNFLGEPIAKAIGAIAPTKVGQKLVKTTSRFDKPTARWSDFASVAITYFYVRNTYKSETMDEDRKLPLMINNVMVTAASSTAALLIDKYTDKPMENLLRGFINNRSDELFEKSKENIVETLQTALEKGKDKVDIDKLKRHADDLLNGTEIKGSLKKAIEKLAGDKTVQKAIQEGIIENDDIMKMAVSGFESQAKKILGSISKAKSLTIFTLTVRFLVTVLMTPVIGRVVDFVNRKILGKNPDDKKQGQPIDTNVGMKDFIASLS